jgi:hypothetical protein
MDREPAAVVRALHRGVATRKCQPDLLDLLSPPSNNSRINPILTSRNQNPDAQIGYRLSGRPPVPQGWCPLGLHPRVAGCPSATHLEEHQELCGIQARSNPLIPPETR